MQAVCDKLDTEPADAADELFKLVGMTLVSSVGGASGPLYGTFFLRLGTACGPARPSRSTTWPRPSAPASKGSSRGAGPSSATRPCSTPCSLRSRPSTPRSPTACTAREAFASAWRPPSRAATTTIPMVARKGRASYLGERSAGHQDPGATSSALLFEAAADAFAARSRRLAVVGIVVVSHSQRAGRGRRRARLADGARRPAADRDRRRGRRPPARNRRGPGQGGHRPCGLARRRARADGPRQRRAQRRAGPRAPRRARRLPRRPLRCTAGRRPRRRHHLGRRGSPAGRGRRRRRPSRSDQDRALLGIENAARRGHDPRAEPRTGRRAPSSSRSTTNTASTPGPRPASSRPSAASTPRSTVRNLTHGGPGVSGRSVERAVHPRRPRRPPHRGRGIRPPGSRGTGRRLRPGASELRRARGRRGTGGAAASRWGTLRRVAGDRDRRRRRRSRSPPSTRTSTRGRVRPRRSASGCWRPSKPAGPSSRRPATRSRPTTGAAEADIFTAHLLLLDDDDLAGRRRRARRRGTRQPRRRPGDGRSTRWPPVSTTWPTPTCRRGPTTSAPSATTCSATCWTGRRRPTDAPRASSSPPTSRPPQAARLDPPRVAAIVTAVGTAVSHAAILARSLGIPAVVGAGDEVLAVPDGTTIVVDGSEGMVLVDPDPDVRGPLPRSGRRPTAPSRQPALQAPAGPPSPPTGHGSRWRPTSPRVDDAVQAVDHGADGVGLLRTEFLFLDRARPARARTSRSPSTSPIAEALAGRRLTVRTLDVGGDKPVPYLPVTREANPFLGRRGLRAQPPAPRRVQAAAAGPACALGMHHPVTVLFPMVTTHRRTARRTRAPGRRRRRGRLPARPAAAEVRSRRHGRGARLRPARPSRQPRSSTSSASAPTT